MSFLSSQNFEVIRWVTSLLSPSKNMQFCNEQKRTQPLFSPPCVSATYGSARMCRQKNEKGCLQKIEKFIHQFSEYCAIVIYYCLMIDMHVFYSMHREDVCFYQRLHVATILMKFTLFFSNCCVLAYSIFHLPQSLTSRTWAGLWRRHRWQTAGLACQRLTPRGFQGFQGHRTLQQGQ